MNTTQIQTTLAPLVSFLAGLLAAKIPWLDAGAWTQIIGALMGVGATIWAAVATKNSSIAATTQAMPGVNVTTTAAAPAGVTAAVETVKAAG